MSFLDVLKTVLIIPKIVESNNPPAGGSFANVSKMKTITEAQSQHYWTLSSSDKIAYIASLGGSNLIVTQAISEDLMKIHVSSSSYNLSTSYSQSQSIGAKGMFDQSFGLGTALITSQGAFGGTSGTVSGTPDPSSIDWTKLIQTGISTLPGLISSIFGGGSTTASSTASNTGAGTVGINATINSLLSKLGITPSVSTSVSIPTWIWFAVAGIVILVLYPILRGRKR
jgi:hypothetical protein